MTCPRDMIGCVWIFRCLLDTDDEVRDRATFYLNVLRQQDKALSSAYILNGMESFHTHLKELSPFLTHGMSLTWLAWDGILTAKRLMNRLILLLATGRTARKWMWHRFPKSVSTLFIFQAYRCPWSAWSELWMLTSKKLQMHRLTSRPFPWQRRRCKSKWWRRTKAVSM